MYPRNLVRWGISSENVQIGVPYSIIIEDYENALYDGPGGPAVPIISPTYSSYSAPRQTFPSGISCLVIGVASEANEASLSLEFSDYQQYDLRRIERSTSTYNITTLLPYPDTLTLALSSAPPGVEVDFFTQFKIEFDTQYAMRFFIDEILIHEAFNIPFDITDCKPFVGLYQRKPTGGE